ALVLAAAGSPTPGAYPGRNGRILFDSARGGSFDIYTMNLSGKQMRRLTRSSSSEVSGAWSPDGRSIAYTRGGRKGSVFVMTASGRKVRRVTPPSLDASDPT